MAEPVAESAGGGASVPSTNLASGTPASRAAAPSFDFGGWGEKVVSSLKRGDLGFALGLVMIMVVLIMPLPAWLLDISLAMSITLAVLILMTVVFIQKAMEFNSF